jgi:hypothetical protein
MAIVKPLVHSFAEPCSCGNLFQHWKNCSGQSIYFCPVVHCLEKDLKGMQVTLTEDSSQKVYVIPLCPRHAKSGHTLQISDAYRLVPVGHEADCGENLPMVQKTDIKTKIHSE